MYWGYTRCSRMEHAVFWFLILIIMKRTLKNGNSAFVDENWNAYPDQWDVLLNQTKKLSLKEI